jgi:electron transfer flavoprotein beta subunit
MNIIVCLKQTPVTAEVELSVDEAGKSINTKGLVYELNEWDEYALEEATLIKEKLGGSVTVITMGPEGADAVLRRGLAKGADSAIWLKDEAFQGSDGYATARILTRAIEKIDFDLILCGAQSSDAAHSSVGGITAELLGIPHASMVKKAEIEEGRVTVNRELEGGLEEVMEIGLPALLTIQTGINEPRYVSIMGIRRARKKEVKTLGLADLGLEPNEVGEEGSWLKVEKMYAPPAEKEAIILSGSPEETAAKIVEVLKTKGVI